jgi:hypothetical protein
MRIAHQTIIMCAVLFATPVVEDASGCYEWRGRRICKDPSSVTQNAETDDQRMTKVAETCVDYVHSLAGRGWWFANFQAYWDPGIREFQYMETTPAEGFEFWRCLITQGVRAGPAHLMPGGSSEVQALPTCLGCAGVFSQCDR